MKAQFTNFWGGSLFGGLFSKLPISNWIFAPGFGLKRARRFTPTLAKDQATPKGMLDIELPESYFLTKKVTIPVTAMAKQAKVLDLHMAQSLPQQGKDVVWRADRPVIDGKIAKIKVFILKKEQLKDLQQKIEGKGRKIRSVRLKGYQTVPAFLDNRSKTDRSSRVWFCLGLLCPILMIAFLTSQYFAQSQSYATTLEELREQTITLRNEALVLTQARQETVSKAAIGFADIEMNTLHRRRLLALKDLTDLMEDEAWITEITFSEATIRLNGASKTDVVDLLSALQQKEWVERARLDGPVNFDSFAQVNSFDLLISLSKVSLDGSQ